MSPSPLALLAALTALGTTVTLLLGSREQPVAVTAHTPKSRRSLSREAEGYERLAFEELYVTPVGPKGLEHTARARELNGKPVRMEGFMVRHYHEDPALFLFAPVPAAHNQTEYILADSLPVSLVHVEMQVRPGDAPSWQPQKLTVMGRLELGARQEADGRVSHVRIFCEHVADSRTQEAVELRKPLALQRDRMMKGPPASFRPQRANQDKAAIPTSTP